MRKRNKTPGWLSVLKAVIKPVAALLALVLIVIWTTGVLRERIPPGTLPLEPGLPLPVTAVILYVEKSMRHRPIDLTGTIKSEKTIQIAARINAHITEVHVTTGSRVSQGTPLVSLDDSELLQHLNQAKARLDLAETEYNRTKRLFESEAATHKDYMAARSEFERARAGHEEINVTLGYTRLNAPIDGIIAERHIESGDFARTGQILMTLYDHHAMRIEVPVPARLSNRISIGDLLPIEIDGVEARHTAVVTEIEANIDPAARTRTIKITLPNMLEPADIAPGAFGRAWIETGPVEGIFIPESTVYRTGQLEMVHYVTDGRVINRLVKTGPRQNGLVEILSGLSEGDAILIRPLPPTSANPSNSQTGG